MSFATESRDRARPVLPLAGMVDVLFLLLVFFLTTGVLREAESQIPIDLAIAESAEAPGASGVPEVVSFGPDGAVYLGTEAVTIDQLKERLTGGQVRAVVIRGDVDANFGVFVQVLDVVNELGLSASVAAIKPAE